MNTPSVIILQVGDLASTEVSQEFDRHGIQRDQDYTFFNGFEPGFLECFVSGAKQLVFTSNIGEFNAVDVAAKVKFLNPLAIVIALSSIKPSEDLDILDGFIDKGDDGYELARVIIKAFLNGETVKQIKMRLTFERLKK